MSEKYKAQVRKNKYNEQKVITIPKKLCEEMNITENTILELRKISEGKINIELWTRNVTIEKK